MKEDDLLYILYQYSCYDTEKDDILRFLADAHLLTLNGSDFENEIITSALDELNWTYICSVQRDRKDEFDTELFESSDEEDEEEELFNDS